MMQNLPGHLLVIGGAGYVGSHFVHFAIERGFQVDVLDNLSKGHMDAVKNSLLIHGDVTEPEVLENILNQRHYDGILHFAASCLVGESVQDPALYYKNNVVAAYGILEAMRRTSHNKLVFSSTCAVYGAPDTVPITENHPKNPISPYGRTKLAIEWMLEDYQNAYGMRSAMLRYFNAAGCEPGHGLGEDHRPENHLIPNVARFALGLDPKLTIYGDDYPTPDGTCVRDYIHVSDLAEAHLTALKELEQTPLIKLNLGVGKGISNLEIVKTFEMILGKTLDLDFGPRRPGDPPELVADASAAMRMLTWKATRSDIRKIAKEVIAWFDANPTGYNR